MKNWRKKFFIKVLAVFLIFSWMGLVSAETINYYHHDILGTPLVVTDESGDVVWWANYYPYGSKHDGNSSDTKPQRFTGKEFDEELGLYYFGARYYNPTIARFISVDPDKGAEKYPQSWNRYSYCDNNPMVNVDPTGRYVETAVDIASLAWSINDLRKNPGSVWNWVALGADVVTLALPAAAAGGTIIRTGKATKAVKGLKKVDKASDFVHIAPKAAKESIEELGLKASRDGYVYLTKGEHLSGKKAKDLSKVLYRKDLQEAVKSRFKDGAIKVEVKGIKPKYGGVTTRPGGVPQWKHRGNISPKKIKVKDF